MSLRIHMAAEITTPPTGGTWVRTACNRKGFKAAQRANPDGEWEAVRQIGGLIAFSARRWEAAMAGREARHACARCRDAWMAGAEAAPD